MLSAQITFLLASLTVAVNCCAFVTSTNAVGGATLTETFTVSANFCGALWETGTVALSVPVTVMLYVPDGVLAVVTMVSVPDVAGEAIVSGLQVVPAGKLPHVIATDPVYPLIEVTVTVVVAFCPCTTLCEVGEIATVKSVIVIGAFATAPLAVAVRITVPVGTLAGAV
jgi:hypothetical protein